VQIIKRIDKVSVRLGSCEASWQRDKDSRGS